MMNKHTMKHHLTNHKKTNKKEEPKTKALSFQTGKNMASLHFFYKRTTQNSLQLSSFPRSKSQPFLTRELHLNLSFLFPFLRFLSSESQPFLLFSFLPIKCPAPFFMSFTGFYSWLMVSSCNQAAWEQMTVDERTPGAWLLPCFLV